jgi:hypothetical protein
MLKQGQAENVAVHTRRKEGRDGRLIRRLPSTNFADGESATNLDDNDRMRDSELPGVDTSPLTMLCSRRVCRELSTMILASRTRMLFRYFYALPCLVASCIAAYHQMDLSFCDCS